MCGREIAVGEALGKDRLRHLAMQPEPLGLPVLLVPGEVEPSQAVENRGERGFGVAFHVGIVDAENHGATVVAGVEPVEDEGTGAADVEKTRG